MCVALNTMVTDAASHIRRNTDMHPLFVPIDPVSLFFYNAADLMSQRARIVLVDTFAAVLYHPQICPADGRSLYPQKDLVLLNIRNRTFHKPQVLFAI